MLTFQDCIGLSALTEEEISLVAAHERVPSIAALEMGDFLLHQPEGAAWMRRLVENEIEKAARRRDFERAAQLMIVLRRFVTRYSPADAAGNRKAASVGPRAS